MSMHRSAATCSLLVVLGLASTASADDARSIDVAKKSYEEGVAQYKNNDLEGARLSFAQSYAAWPALETLRSLAIAEFDTGRCLDSLKHFKMYLKDRNADPAFVKKLPKYVDPCNERVGHVRISAPAGAAILVDGHRVFDLREPIDVAPGTHAIAMRDGSFIDARSQPVSAGQTVDVTFTRREDGSTAPTAPSSTTADTGSHFWTARNSVTIGLGAAAVASAAVMTGFAIAASNAHSKYDELHAQTAEGACLGSTNALCTDLSSAASTQRTDSRIANGALVVTAAFAVSAAVVFFAWPKSDRETGGLVIAPSVSQNAGGVFAVGRF